MNEPRRALLLIGSPRGPRSTSASLGEYLLKRLRNYGWETEEFYIHSSLKYNEDRTKMLHAVDTTDLLILSFPLYVDCLPAPVIATLEMIAEHRKKVKTPRVQKILVIVNSGFPEAAQSNIALAICRRFASAIDIEWAGGLALGGGEAIEGRPLDEIGGMARNVKRALDIAAAALFEERAVPQGAISLMARPLIPVWLYLWAGSWRWKRRAKKYGAKKRLYDRPYQK